MWKVRYMVLVLSIEHVGNAATATSKTADPAPIVVVPSQDWDGNDGPWSSFIAQIGTPRQTVKLFVSTASSQIWAIATEGCGAGDLTTCKHLRGNLFNYTASSTYITNLADPSGDYYRLGLESNLGYTGNGRFGFDDVTLGLPGTGGPTLRNQTVGGVATKDFFVGILGLMPRPNNFTEYNDPIPSYMESLWNQSIIPSLSWGYTAGNQYRFNGVLGSLTLGGYDASRFVANNLTIPLAAEDAKDLTVQILNITTGNGTQPFSTPIGSFLDSTIPYIYLPAAACTLFEKEFGLSWNETSQLYFISDTQHVINKAKKPSVTFTIGSLQSTTTVDITLPYAAFALTASWPLVPIPTRFFPLKRASNSTQYTLGRTFFQEAYVIADYNRRTFSVSQCKWDAGTTEKIVKISAPVNVASLKSKTSSGFPMGALAGVAVAGVVLLAALVAYLFWWLPQCRSRIASLNTVVVEKQDFIIKPELDCSDRKQPAAAIEVGELEKSSPVELDTESLIHELPANEIAEMEGKELPREMDVRSHRWSFERFRLEKLSTKGH